MKLQKLFEDEAFVKQILGAQSADEVKAMCAAKGVSVTDEEIAQMGEEITSLVNGAADGELSENNLEKVSGGFLITGTITTIGVIKAVTAVGSAGLAIWAWYKSAH